MGLVLTGTDRFFSNGLDLDGVRSPGFDVASYLARVQDLFARVLTAGHPTAAALNGHTYAAAAMLAMCCDHRVMRADRGWWCLPEADLGLPFTPGMSALCAASLPAAVVTRTMVFAERLGGADAARLGVVEQAVEGDAASVERAAVPGSRHAWARTAGPSRPSSTACAASWPSCCDGASRRPTSVRPPNRRLATHRP